MFDSTDQNISFRSVSSSLRKEYERLDDIEDHVCEGCENNLDSKILKRFWKMNSREFVDYLANGENHQAEIEYYLTRKVDEKYANEVLNELRERYRYDLIISSLSFWKFG